jgi:dynein heavy chain
LGHRVPGTHIEAAICVPVRPCNKGWFNLHETNHVIHDYSKLKRFLTMTRFRMEDTLRFLVEESLETFGDFISKVGWCRLNPG